MRRRPLTRLPLAIVCCAVLTVPVTSLAFVSGAKAVGSACSPWWLPSSGDVVATIETVGSCEWTVPAGITSISISVIGGGGGGGGGYRGTGSTYTTVYLGGGGGGGGQFQRETYVVTPGATYTMTVGPAGTAGVAATSGSAAGDGGEGGPTSVTGLPTALTVVGGKGGGGGSLANGNRGGNGGESMRTGGLGGGGLGAVAGLGIGSSVGTGGGGGGATYWSAGTAAPTGTGLGGGGNGANGSEFRPSSSFDVGGGGGGGAGLLPESKGVGGTGGGGYGGSQAITYDGPQAGGNGLGGGGGGGDGGGGVGDRAPANGGAGGSGRIGIVYAALLTPITQTISGTVGTPISASTPLVNSLLSRPTFTVDPSSPALPSGLTLNASTGAISGTPTSQQAPVTIVIRGTDRYGYDWATAQVSISVAAGSGGGSSQGGGTPEPSATASATPTPTPTATASSATALGPVTNASNSGFPASGVAPGTGVLIVDGEKVPVTVQPDARDEKQLEVTGPGFTMSLAGLNAQGKPLGLTSDGALILEPDRTAAVAGTGFQPNTLVYLYLFSEPRFIGTVETDANGTFNGRVPLPADIADGRHTLQSNGFTPDGAVRSLSLGVVLATPVAAMPKRATAKVYFGALSSVLTDEGKASLTSLVKKTGKKAVRTVSIGFVQGTTITANDEALSTHRAKNVAAYLKTLGLKGRFVVRGDGIAKESGLTARRVDISVAYLK